MKASNLLGSTALALVMCSAMTLAQVQQKGEEKASPGAGAASKSQSEKGAQQSESKGKSSAQRESGQNGSERSTQGAERSQSKEQGAKSSAQSEQRTKGSNQTEKSEHGTKGAQTQPRENRKGTAQTEPNEHGTKGTAQTERREQGTKGSAQTERREQGTKGTAQTERKDQGTKGTAQTERKEQGTKGTAQTEPREQGTKGSARTQPSNQTAKGGSRERVQLSEQQRTNFHETILKERNVNRIDHVNFSINVGTRVPRSVHLVPLPAAVFSIVPQFRSYRYFVASDEICIVDPNTYEIVEVIPAGTQTARGHEPSGMAHLSLTREEERIVLDSVNTRGESTLALGSLSEGSPVPRGARLENFPQSVVQQVPKLRGHKYFAAEDRVAITDPQATKIQLVIDAKR
jgi:hypothetical protein